MKEVDISNIGTLSIEPKEESKKQQKPNLTLQCFDYINILVTTFSFVALAFISVFSLIWLYEYNFIFTIYRYINSVKYFYFPIQVSSLILYGIAIFNTFTIVIACIYYVEKIVMERKKKFYFSIPKYHCIPLISNLILYMNGSNIDNKSTKFSYLYYLNLFLVLISLYYLLNYYYVSYFNGLKNEFNLNLISGNNKCYNFENEEVTTKEDIHFFNIVIFGFFYGVLLSMNLYYFFYLICQIICSYISDVQILVFIGDVVIFFLGLVAIYTAFQLKSIIMAFYFSIIYNGILAFYYSIAETERKKIGLGMVQVIINIFFIIGFSLEMIYLFILKKQRMNSYQTLNATQD